jgi:hypothetical protein
MSTRISITAREAYCLLTAIRAYSYCATDPQDYISASERSTLAALWRVEDKIRSKNLPLNEVRSALRGESCPTCRDTKTVCAYCGNPLDECACNNDASVDGVACEDCS